MVLLYYWFKIYLALISSHIFKIGLMMVQLSIPLNGSILRQARLKEITGIPRKYQMTDALQRAIMHFDDPSGEVHKAEVLLLT